MAKISSVLLLPNNIKISIQKPLTVSSLPPALALGSVLVVII